MEFVGTCGTNGLEVVALQAVLGTTTTNGSLALQDEGFTIVVP